MGLFSGLLSGIAAFLLCRTDHTTVQNSRERAVEASRILNDFIADLIDGTRSFEYFNTTKFKAGATNQVLRGYNKMANSYIFLTLAKWIEFYDRYHVVIPQKLRATCKKMRNDLDNRGVKKFRNEVVGHIWSRKHNRPLLIGEIEELENKITNGDANRFLRWINEPDNNCFGTTIVGTSEVVRNEIMNKWSLSKHELFD